MTRPGTDGNSPALVMVGVLADVTRLGRTNVEFTTVFSGLSEVASTALTEQKQKSDKLAELLFSPPAWSDEFYQRGAKEQCLDQVLDTAFYAKSHHVGLVQVADLYAFIFRRCAELLDYGARQNYDGERARITEWVELLAPRLLGRAHRWPANPSCDAARWYVRLAPPSLRNIK